jgi:hypothetical protein
VWPDLAQVAASKQLLQKSMSEPEGCFESSGMSVWDSLEYEREPDYKIFESYGYDGHRCSGGPCQFQMSNLSITSQFLDVPGRCLVTCYHSDLSRFLPTTSNPEQSSATLASFAMKRPPTLPNILTSSQCYCRIIDDRAVYNDLKVPSLLCMLPSPHF